jgi:predicted PolB exonuclease-like 3'-5' exonuclease
MPWRKWGEGLVDTMQLWTLTNPREGFVKLDTIAKFLGCSRKTDGWTGASVWPAWQAGEHDRIRAYCAQDVEVVRAVHRRMAGLA